MEDKRQSAKPETWLSPYQIWYWKSPEKRRAAQRDKYKRCPKKIYAANRAWQLKNKEHFNMLCKFGSAVRKARKAGDTLMESVLVKAREEYKKSWRLAKAGGLAGI